MNLKEAYAAEAPSGGLAFKIYPVGHLETAGVRQETVAFLQQGL